MKIGNSRIDLIDVYLSFGRHKLSEHIKILIWRKLYVDLHGNCLYIQDAIRKYENR